MALSVSFPAREASLHLVFYYLEIKSFTRWQPPENMTPAIAT